MGFQILMFIESFSNIILVLNLFNVLKIGSIFEISYLERTISREVSEKHGAGGGDTDNTEDRQTMGCQRFVG